ncbi:hypothetical protein DFH06DRAFT_1347134 [Mycena polygramma]|nr:hypothetical protein DFH06DRAFT_1347134 [Mycena polygramma]
MTTATRKKKGPAGHFVGENFLREHLPTYIDASRRGKTRAIWTPLFSQYWTQFPWCLPLKQDPDSTDLTDYSKAPENEAEKEQKETIISTTETKIGHWMGRQGKKETLRGNPWSGWLTRFRTPTTLPPKRPGDWQHYMQQEEFKEMIEVEYKKRKPDVHKGQLLNLRGIVAREFFAKESVEVQERMKEENDTAQAALMEKHKDALEGPPGLDEADLAVAWALFSALVEPLLAGLAAHTGYEISLLAGRVKTEGGNLDIEAMSLHAGMTAESPAALDFSKADVKVYADVIHKFSHFVWDEHRNGRTVGSAVESEEQTASGGGATGAACSTIVNIAPVHRDPTVAQPAVPNHGNAQPAAPNPGNAQPAVPNRGNAEALNDEDILRHLGTPMQMEDDFSLAGSGSMNFDDLGTLDSSFNFPDDIMPGPVPNNGELLFSGMLPPVDPYSNGFAAALCNDLQFLQMILEELDTGARESRIAYLQLLTAEEVERENNVARNHYMLRGLGLGDEQKETLWGGTGKAKAKRQRKSELEQLEGEEDRESETESEALSNAKKTQKTRPAPPEAKPMRGGATSTKDQQPKEWAVKAKAFLCNADFGWRWDALNAVSGEWTEAVADVTEPLVITTPSPRLCAAAATEEPGIPGPTTVNNNSTAGAQRSQNTPNGIRRGDNSSTPPALHVAAAGSSEQGAQGNQNGAETITRLGTLASRAEAAGLSGEEQWEMENDVDADAEEEG